MKLGLLQNILEDTDPSNYEVYNALKRRNDIEDIIFLRPKDIRITILNGDVKFFFKNLELSRELVDLIIIRSVTTNVPMMIEFIKFCRKIGIKVFDNNLTELGFMINKKADFIKLASNGLPIPNTWIFASLDELESYDLKYPVVIKTTNSGKGKNVFLAHCLEQARLFILEKDRDITNFVFQEFIDYKYDLRVLVLGDEIAGCMQRIPSADSFVANFSKGGSVSKFVLNEEIKKLAIKAKNACGLVMAGVDILIDKDDNYYVLEANKYPGIEGLTLAEGDLVADKVTDFLLRNAY